MTHVESANDVIHSMNIERLKINKKVSPPPPITPNWETEVLSFRCLDQHLPQLRFQRFQNIRPRFAIADLLKLLMLESIGWMIPQNWRCP